jgi:hypothetical protein
MADFLIARKIGNSRSRAGALDRSAASALRGEVPLRSADRHEKAVEQGACTS